MSSSQQIENKPEFIFPMLNKVWIFSGDRGKPPFLKSLWQWEAGDNAFCLLKNYPKNMNKH